VRCGVDSWYLWTLDAWYRSADQEAPYLKKLPSEYFMEHVAVGTYDLETPPRAGDLATVLESMDGFEDVLVFASGTERDLSVSVQAMEQLPAEWHERYRRRMRFGCFPGSWCGAGASSPGGSDIVSRRQRGNLVQVRGPIIDVDVHTRPRCNDDMRGYLSEEWRDYLAPDGRRACS